MLSIAVALARLLFPSEAKLAIDIAHAETTSDLATGFPSKGSNGNLRQVDLNETPIMQKQRLLARMQALMKTGEGLRFKYPHIQVHSSLPCHPFYFCIRGFIFCLCPVQISTF